MLVLELFSMFRWRFVVSLLVRSWNEYGKNNIVYNKIPKHICRQIEKDEWKMDCRHALPQLSVQFIGLRVH